MKSILAAACLCLLAGTATAGTDNFDSAKAGQLPEGWLAGVTGSGKFQWAVEEDATAPSKPNVLKQSGEGTYPWCVKKDASLVDGHVEVKFKPISGKEDQAGGLIWRWQDVDNYYIARANALEDNVTIYHTVKGKRTERKRTEMKVTTGQWHTLRVDFKGSHFTVTFDGHKAIEWDDDTFKKPGAVGVWTKADSVTLFDDFSYGPTSAAKEPLSLLQSIPLPGVEGRIDHMAIDETNGRLYVAALGNNTVEVLDLHAGKRIDSLKGFQEPQGIAIAPDSQRVIVASGQDGKCRIFDQSLKLAWEIKDLDDADNVRYDATVKRAFVGYGSGGLAIIDPQAGSKVSDIKLDGHPESFQLETNGRRIFVNVPTAGHVAVLDRDKQVVVAKWTLKGASSNFPMALDETNHRLFIGCRKPAQLLVLDTETGATQNSLDVSGDTDDVFFDEARKRIYISGGEGTITVVAQRDADSYEVLQKVPTAAGARTSLFDRKSGLLYIAVPHRGGQQAEIRVFRTE